MNSILLKNATIYPITSKPIQNGSVLIKDGKIKQIYSHSVESSREVSVYDCQGKFLFPGFIDSHTHLGLYDEGTGWAGNDANETIEPMTPHIRAFDGVYPLDPGFKDALKYGVTTVNVMPGSANVIGGTTSVIKTYGSTIRTMLIKETSGLKIALGENPKRIHSTGNNDSITRMGIMGMLREAFFSAKYCDQPEDLRVAPLVSALKREIPVRIHAHRADDILSAVRFAEEFNLDFRIEHCTEGHLISEEFHGKNVKVSVGPTFTRRSKVELKNKSWITYQKLTEAGVEVSITTDHPYTPIQYLNMCAAIAVREGLAEQKALEGITILPARNLGVSDRIGSIEVNKDADLVLWSHHPFHFMAKPIITMVNGEIAYQNV
ncbi:amidohydrolase [Rossellomorea aquimaris]|uniref:Amidohydrolase n=1 Tax=Rossellomorea aquimaris TaxID=189382 RepID=A0A5D4UGP1_9BACI|nr:amidohydrolase [Rossellomorea aquimaris]TYS77275.1 amidohydrolase [Rossellomorea aquimaris]TYS86452.1 amidohydrolase [Rossellomorea aquimaris]WRP04920.1 amidohydrolase [Rossellomorea aquimaris]